MIVFADGDQNRHVLADLDLANLKLIEKNSYIILSPMSAGHDAPYHSHSLVCPDGGVYQVNQSIVALLLYNQSFSRSHKT